MDELHRAVAPFIYSSGGGLPGGSMGHGEGGSPLRRGVVRGERECGPIGYGHRGASSKSGKKGDHAMYRDGRLALDIEDESDIQRGLDAYFSDLHDFPSNEHRLRRLKLVADMSLLALLSKPTSSSLDVEKNPLYLRVLLLPSLTSKGKGVKLNASLAHSERISALAEVEKGVKDGSSSSSALLAASSQLSSKRWFARAIVRISSTMSTESSTRNHFFDILEKIKQFSGSEKVNNLSEDVLKGESTEMKVMLSFPWKRGAVDGRGITGLFGSMVGKLSSLERIDRQAALHAVTLEEIRVEISESSPLRPYISSIQSS
ncbi:hypothetical protein Tco_0615564 [Tanacetum coccineum]